jgi:hypothetical protein
MKNKFIQIMSLMLAMMLQMAPLLRSIMPTQGLAPSAWGFILKLGLGATALMGFDAVSQASSIAISPANATVGTFYSGTVSYSGGHSGSVSSMSLTNVCMSSTIPFLDGLSIVYTSGNKATVTGTPTGAGTFAFTLKIIDHAGCTAGGNTDTQHSALVVGPSGGGPVAPSMTAAPQNTCAQVGTDVLLSGGAAGTPIPSYQWWTGVTPIVGATNSILSLTNVQLTNAQSFTLTASNSQNVGATFITLPKAACTLSVCITGGTNFTAFNYTNYAPAGVSLTMFSMLTNVSTATNYYSWSKGGVPLSSSNTYPLVPTLVGSGTYTVTFNSTNANGALVSAANYDSIWAFGYIPAFTNSLPASTNVNAGATVTFNIGVRGTLDTYYSAGQVTNAGVPNIFWYQGNTLVATQSLVLAPTTGTLFTNSVTNASLTLPAVTAANNGNYTVVVTNFWGSITSSPVALTVTSSSVAPGIATNPPANLSLLAGQSSAISVTVTGTPPFFYQWRKGGSNLANGGVYGGVFTNILTLTSVLTNNSGNYTVAITNATGSITSSVAAVNIVLPPDLGAAVGSPGIVQFNGNTVTGLTYIVQLTTNLAAPNWSPVLTNNTGVTGAINFQTNTVSGPNKFYRLLFP